MQYTHFPWRLATTLAIACAAGGSAALTLGRAQGVALVGRALDVTVPLTLQGSGESLPECTTADVFYGDSRVDAARVRTDVQPTPTGASVRIRAATAVDEPVVTLYLNVGCTGKVTRRFVLLSEQPPSIAEPPRVAEPALAAPVARPTPRSAPSAEPPAPALAGAARPSRPAVTARASAPAPQRDAPRGAARLKLEPLDLGEPGEPALRLSAEMAAPEEEGAADRRARAAALWRALTAQPDELLRDSQRIASLEKDFAAMRQAVERNDAALARMRIELEQAREARYANPLVYTLGALLLLAVAGAVYAWRRRRQQPAWDDSSPDWWRTRDGQVPSDYASVPAPVASRPSPGDAAAAPAARVASVPDLSVTEAAVERVRASSASRGLPDFHASMRSDFQLSQPAAMRAVRAEELHDIQQEADFFISLGDHARAIEVLRNHISMNPETSAVAWLDLLEIHHRLQHRDDYEAVRQEFLRNFNVQVPPFDAYGERPAGLVDHPDAMARIVALWPSRTVLELIEETIFRKPGASGAEAFSLEAYRDLLLLHHVGQEVVDAAQYQDSEGATTGGFSSTVINPLSAQRSNGSARSQQPPELPGLSQLDVNLDEPVPGARWIGQAQPTPVDSGLGSMLDFDLPDVPTTELKPDRKSE